MSNYHPLLVHFPVALLSLYAFAEIIRFKTVNNQPYWFYIKAVLVICGTLASYLAYATGDSAKYAVLSGQDGFRHLVNDPRAVINMHENWANVTVIIFSALAGGYLIAWLKTLNFERFMPGKFLGSIWKLLVNLEKAIIETKFVIILALAGLAAVTITGSLGGAIVYGPNADPFVKIIYGLLIK